MSSTTHYRALGVQRTASTYEIKVAYRKILLANHPDKTLNLWPFAKSQADKAIRTANAAWEVLSVPITRMAYDNSLPLDSPYDDYASGSNGDGFFGGSSANPFPEQPWRPSASDTQTSPQADTDDTPDEHETKEAEYRTMQTPNSTVMDIKISEWRLTVMISSKFRFTNDISELSDSSDDSGVVSFEVGLELDKTSTESHEPSINELTVKVQETPGNLQVTKVQTLFKEVNPRTSPVITITADNKRHNFTPWEFGFDFDLNDQFQTTNRARGTCMIFSIEEPPMALQAGRGLDTPENALKWDKQLKANAWCDLGDDRVGKAKYGEMEMWRLVAVGYSKGSHFRVWGGKH